MLDKLGKADLGDATKAMGLIFAIGLILAVIGGTLNVMIGNDSTDYADSDIITEGDDNDGTTVDATKMIGHFHQTGKGVVGLLAFWFPIIGMILIAVGIGTLTLKGAVFYTLMMASGVLGALILLESVVSLPVVIAFYLLALYLDVKSTITSQRFPKYERNLVIACLYTKMKISQVWLVYGVVYAVTITSGYILLDSVYMVFAVMGSVHIAASIGNILHESNTRQQIIVE